MELEGKKEKVETNNKFVQLLVNERVQKSSSSFLQTSANLRSSLGPFEFNWLEHTNNLTDLNEAKANPRLYPTKHSLINPFISSPICSLPHLALLPRPPTNNIPLETHLDSTTPFTE